MWLELRGDPADGWQAVTCEGQTGYVAVQFIGSEPPPAVTEEIVDEPEVIEEEEPVPSTSAPPGSNPQFDGARLSIASAWDDESGNAWAAIDDSTDTAWAAQQLTLDLGSEAEIS